MGATTAGALIDHVSTPPLPHELSERAKRDWLTGVELVKTCMATHDTQTYVLLPSPVDSTRLLNRRVFVVDSLQRSCISGLRMIRWWIGQVGQTGISKDPSKEKPV